MRSAPSCRSSTGRALRGGVQRRRAFLLESDLIDPSVRATYESVTARYWQARIERDFPPLDSFRGIRLHGDRHLKRPARRCPAFCRL